jgi:nifR3 family TIM-barrel protein
MKIGNLHFKSGIFLAPMAGVNDVGFRAIAKYFGAELAYTEMVSAKGLIYGEGKALKTPLNQDFVKSQPRIASNKSAWLLLTEDIEDKKVVQIFGGDPKFMARACQHERLQKFDIIDINMGCPAPKIIKNGEGSALMTDLDRAHQIIKTCIDATDKPVTVKFRKGLKINNAIEFAKMCEQAGASAISVHTRFANQGYSGIVDYALIKQIKAAVKIPVIGSGDIKDIETYKKMLECGVDGVMIGRASFGNPMIFKELVEFSEGKTPIRLIDFVQKDDFFSDVLTDDDLNILKKDDKFIAYICAKKHLAILRKYYAEAFLTKYLRKHMLWYANNIKLDAEAKQKIAVSNDLELSLNLLKSHFKN